MLRGEGAGKGTSVADVGDEDGEALGEDVLLGSTPAATGTADGEADGELAGLEDRLPKGDDDGLTEGDADGENVSLGSSPSPI